MSGRVLVVEDDDRLADYISRGLLEQNFTVDRAANGRDGLFLATDAQHDVLMVVMNPAESVQLKRHIRAIDPQAFVILLDASEVRGQGFLPHV